MAWQQILALSFLFQMIHSLAAQQCGINSYSVDQMMLRGHTYKAFKARPGSLECRHACSSDVRCQSYNYVTVEHICEMNNRTRQARPDDFVKNSNRYYVTKVPKRGISTISFPDPALSLSSRTD